MTHEVLEIEKKDASRVHILTGIVTDTGSGVVDVDIDDHGVVSDILVFYHCPDSETADGNPFSIDDRVIIVNSGGDVDVANMKVVGYADGLPRSCVWEPWNWPGLCAAEDGRWSVSGWRPGYIPEICPILPFYKQETDPITGSINTHSLQINDGVLNLKVNAGLVGGIGQTSSMEVSLEIFTTYLPSSKLKIKVAAECSPTDPTSFKTMGYLWVREETTNHTKYFIFCKADFTPTGDLVYIGDNGGEEQIIDLTDYGFNPEYGIAFVCIVGRCDYGNHVYMDVDYMHFMG